MAMFLKRLSRFEHRMDNAMEKFLFHHRFFGGLVILIGLPLITLIAVCLFTAAIAFPIGLFFGLVGSYTPFLQKSLSCKMPVL